MIVIMFFDGSCCEFENFVSVMDVVQLIGVGLVKVIIVGLVDGVLVDVSDVIDYDVSLCIIIVKDEEGVEIICYFCVYLVGYVVKQFYFDVKMVIGLVIVEGFYYDIYVECLFMLEDMVVIEKCMGELIVQDYDVIKKVILCVEVIEIFKVCGEDYKLCLIEDMFDDIQVMGMYYYQEYVDMCCGLYVLNMCFFKVFKLICIFGVYWCGDVKNEQLQCIYGIVWVDKKQFEVYIKCIEEVEMCDYCCIGRQQELFYLQEEVLGLVFWYFKGWVLWQVVEQYMCKVYCDSGYGEVCCLYILDVLLWQKFGYWDNYQENMFFIELEKCMYVVKLMNCLGYIQVFNQGLYSYCDLLICYGEFGLCYCNELFGVLYGILCVCGFIQDDGYVFCIELQIEVEVIVFYQQVLVVYMIFGFEDIQIKIVLCLEKCFGDDVIWDKVEGVLCLVLGSCGVEWQELLGEGVFYGLKIEYYFKDVIGCIWQLGMMQVDFMMFGCFGVEYVDENSQKKYLVMLYWVIVGLMECFIGILIEYYVGVFLFWLVLIQVVVVNIIDVQVEYVFEVWKIFVD